MCRPHMAAKSGPLQRPSCTARLKSSPSVHGYHILSLKYIHRLNTTNRTNMIKWNIHVTCDVLTVAQAGHYTWNRRDPCCPSQEGSILKWYHNMSTGNMTNKHERLIWTNTSTTKLKPAAHWAGCAPQTPCDLSSRPLTSPNNLLPPYNIQSPDRKRDEKYLFNLYT